MGSNAIFQDKKAASERMTDLRVSRSATESSPLETTFTQKEQNPPKNAKTAFVVVRVTWRR